MKNIKRTLALLLAMVMVLTMLPLAAVAEDQSPTPTEPQWPNQGAINLTKDAEATGNPNEYEITLTIEGKNYHTSSDVVLVLDKSGSMNDGSLFGILKPPKYKAVITAAKAFGDKLLAADSNARIAIVTYNKTATAYDNGHFYTSAELSDFKSAVERAMKSPTGATHQQAGIHKAQELLSSSSSTNDLKNIVILSDGEPTYSHPFIVSDADAAPSVPVPNYDKTIGGGGDFLLREDSWSSVYGNAGYYSNDSYNDLGSYTYNADGTFTFKKGTTTNNGEATIWEANQAKVAGTRIFSIAINAGDDGEATLRSCASNPQTGYFSISRWESNDAEDKLADAFTAIADSIAIAAKSGKVTDPMSDDVVLQITDGTSPVITTDLSEYEAGNADIYVSQKISAIWDEDAKTIRWNVGDIEENVPAVMKYKVKIADGVDANALVDANKTTTFDYTNYIGEETTKNFPIPKISAAAGVINLHFYRVDADGNPINKDGTAVEKLKFADELKSQTVYVDKDTGKDALAYGKYSVSPDAIDGVFYYGYATSGDVAEVAPSSGAVEVEVSAAEPIKDIWFAYQAGFQIVHVQDGVAGDAVTYPVEENFNITKKVSNGYLYGGTFSDEDCQDVWDWDYENENPTKFTPEAGETYYIWEVSTNYLQPKGYYVWGHPIGHDGKAYVTQLHLLTTVDRELYAEVGFYYDNNVDPNNVVFDNTVTVDELAQTVESYKSGELYDQLYVSLDGTLGSSRNGRVNESDRREGYIGIYSLNADEFAAFEKATLYYQPYWITLDGVRVSDENYCTVTHRGEGEKTVDATPQEHDRDPEYVGVLSPNARSVMAVYTLDYDAAPAAPIVPDEPVQPAAVTVTVHDGETYEITDEPGKFDVTPKGAEGKLFAGWYADEAFTEVADLTDVQEDADIYAKYVSDNYLQVKYNNLGLLGRGSLRLVSAVDSKAYAETGFVVNGEKLVVSSYTTRYNLQNGKTLFGVGRNDPLMVTSYSYKNLRRGDTIEIRAYWITPDGTTVYGDARTLTYGRFGLEG